VLLLYIMRKDKELAIKLRKGGSSYNEIVSLLKIPKATLSDWLRNEKWSTEIKKRLADRVQEMSTARLVDLNKTRGSLLDRAYREAKVEAAQELAYLKYNPLFIAGLMLYWGEGDKVTNGSVRLSNTDPGLIKLYTVFLRDICAIPESKMRGHILVYPDLDKEACLTYWSRESGLDRQYFVKCVTIQGRHKTRRLGYGICSIYVSSTYFKTKMLEWLKLLPIDLMKRD